MTSQLDFQSFKTQYQINSAIKIVVCHLREATDANNRPILHTVQGQPLPLQGILDALNIVDIQQEVNNDFDFELGGTSLAQVRQHCTQNHLDFEHMTMSRASKLYYDANYDRNNRNWMEVSRPDASDPITELQELMYLDSPANQTVDWTNSLDNLKRLGQERLYTADMMHTALLRLVNKFMPEQTWLLKPKTANEIASFLLSMDRKIDRPSYYRQQLFSLARKPGEELSSVLARFRAVLDKVYPNQPQNEANRTIMTKTALIAFTPDFIAIPMLEDLKRAAAECKPYPVEALTDMILHAERTYNVRTTVLLPFDRQIGQQTAATHMQFNSMQVDSTNPLQKRRIPEYNADMYENHFPSYTTPIFDQISNLTGPAANRTPNSSIGSSRSESGLRTPAQELQHANVVSPQQLAQHIQQATVGMQRPAGNGQGQGQYRTPASSPVSQQASQASNQSNLTHSIGQLSLQKQDGSMIAQPDTSILGNACMSQSFQQMSPIAALNQTFGSNTSH